MLHVSPPEHSASSDIKENSDSNSSSLDKSNTATVLIATVQEDEPIVTRKELWSYYLYRNGANNIGPLMYTMTLFQRLATAAGYDPAVGPGSSCLSSTASGQCVLPWMGGTKPVASIVLVANGISFAIMMAILTTIGPVADYGTFGRRILFAATIICWASQYTCMALTSPDLWKLAMVLFIVGYVSYVTAMVFYLAVFPRLGRNTPHSRNLREKYENGQISVEEYEREESLEKSRISNISMVHNNVGYTTTSVLNMALLLPPNTANNPLVDNYTLALDTSYWVLVGVWWFIYQLPRPGPPLPKGENYLTIGWKQIWAALKTYKHLPNTFMFLFAFLLLADGVLTTTTLVSICQNDQFRFSFLQNTYLGLAQYIPSIFSTLGLWYIQQYWKISTKNMYFVTLVVMILIPLWGMIGIWTDKFGFRNAWEFWAYSVVNGLFQIPYFAYSQTMIAELSPPGFENMFFGLCGLSSFASAMIAPYIVQAIIGKTHDNWQGFPFLFAISTAASLVIWFGVDVEKGRRDAVKWAAAQRG
jgi:MFS-type transporter involved in bile tolerance (Atg22 family)